LTQTERKTLADHIWDFLTDAVVADHPHFDHAYTVVDDHRRYLTRLERFLYKRGAKQFIPLPAWDPVTRIPPEFRAVRPYDDGSFDKGGVPRPPIANDDPGIALPLSLQPGVICAEATLPDLWQAMLTWHADVHFGVGGTMQDIHTSPAALIFWPWHAFVDNIYWNWEHCP
jgi:hypothetical protein